MPHPGPRSPLPALVVWLLCTACATSPERPFRVELEAGALWQSRNDAAVPGDTGTRLDLNDLTGSGPFPAARISVDWDTAADHGLRLLAAPLQLTGTGTLDRPTDFQGRTFAAGVPIDATYRFNSYRLTYRYRVVADDTWQVRIGATGLVRDAAIELSQGGISRRETNVGFVPLLHADASARLTDRWRLSADFDGLAVPGAPGRLLDVALRADYDLDDRWSVGIGYRTLEGGVDNDTVFNFAWQHYAIVSIGFRF